MPVYSYETYYRTMIPVRTIQVSFKEIFTSNVKVYNVNQQWSIRKLIEKMTPILSAEFRINESNVDIIEADSNNRNIPAEAGPRLIPCDTTLATLYGSERTAAFYVRNRNHHYPEIDNYRRIERTIGDCPICLDIKNLTTRYQCRHGICSSCYEMCISASINRCSICRAICNA